MHYLGRYKTAECTKIHDTKMSLIILTEDVETKRLVALKAMTDRDQWQREMAMREGEGLDKHVLRVIESCEDANAKGCKEPRPFLISMPAAQMDMNDFLSHSREADNDLKVSVDLLWQVGHHLKYMHNLGRIHGDPKPRNVVRIEGTWCVCLLACLLCCLLVHSMRMPSAQDAH